MLTEENKALSLRWWDDFNARNWAAVYEAIAPDYVFHNASRTIRGLNAFKQFLSMYVTAFPDLHITMRT